MTGWWVIVVFGLAFFVLSFLVGFMMSAGHLPRRRRRT